MSHVIKTYDEDLQGAILHSHTESEKATEDAIRGIDRALTKNRGTGAMIEKAKQSHPQNIFQFLDGIMSPERANRYMRSHRLGLIRPRDKDKAQLLACGVLELQEAYTKPPNKPTPSLFRSITKAVNLINTASKASDCSRWTEDEREVTKRALLPLVELYKELES
jgi:hypothetical protein